MGSPSVFREQDAIVTSNVTEALGLLHSLPIRTKLHRSSMSPNQWRVWSAVMTASRQGRTVWIESNLEYGRLVIFVGQVAKLRREGKLGSGSPE